MSKIHQIPIVVAEPRAHAANAASPDRPATFAVLAILNEIAAKLSDFAAKGLNTVIDLRWLLASPEDLELLRETLGRGEVEATVLVSGRSEVKETCVPCVWWVTHRNHEDRTVAEFVEITEIPEVLRSDPNLIKQGLEKLRVRSAGLESSSFPSSIHQH